MRVTGGSTPSASRARRPAARGGAADGDAWDERQAGFRYDGSTGDDALTVQGDAYSAKG